MATISFTHDVTGNLQQAKGSDSRLNVSSRSDSRSYYNSRDQQEAYSLVWEDADSATGDYILYWKNTDTQGRALVIDSVGLNSSALAQFKLATVTGTASGVTVLPSCLNRSAPRVASASCVEAAGTAITGLTEEVVIDHAGVAAGGHEEFRLDDRLRIGQGGAIAIECHFTATTAKTYGIIYGYYE